MASDPSPAEIARACLVIQSTWSPDEFRRRRVANPGKVAPTAGIERMAREEIGQALARKRAQRAGKT